jgi:hypothetical protein
MDVKSNTKLEYILMCTFKSYFKRVFFFNNRNFLISIHMVYIVFIVYTYVIINLSLIAFVELKEGELVVGEI